MIVYFSSRESARNASFGKLIDNGTSAPKGKRYGRKVAGISGNAHQRKIAFKRYMKGLQNVV